MEAVPRLHMLWFALKSSPEGTSFAALKKVSNSMAAAAKSTLAENNRRRSTN